MLLSVVNVEPSGADTGLSKTKLRRAQRRSRSLEGAKRCIVDRKTTQGFGNILAANNPRIIELATKVVS
jgi:hypothetical protein